MASTDLLESRVATDADAAEARAQTLLDLGRAAQAEAVVRQALAVEPDSTRLLVLLSRAFLAQKRFEDARAQAQAALASDPEDFEGLSCLAAALTGMRKFTPALDAVDRARAVEPMNPGIHVQEARTCVAAGRPARAVRAARQARELAPESADAAAALAESLFFDGQVAEAADLAGEALRLDPENADAHFIAGAVSLRTGAGEESILRYREALRLDPTDEYARRLLAIALNARNPLYRSYLRLGFWFSDLPSGRRWAVRLAPLVLIRIIAPFRDQAWSMTALVIIALFITASWCTEPISNLLLMASPADRAVLHPAAVRSARVFVGFALAAAACFVAVWLIGIQVLIPLGFGLALWAFVAGSTHTVPAHHEKRLTAALYSAAACAIAGAAAASFHDKPATVTLSAVLLFSGAAMTWYVAITQLPKRRD
jgi:tetratricopeptide (TPR) repeat protein